MEPDAIPVTAIRSALMDLLFGEPVRKDMLTLKAHHVCLHRTVHKDLGLCDLTDHTQTQQRDTTLSRPLPTFICNVCLLLVLKLMRLLKATEKPYSNLSSILRDIHQTH